MAVITTYAIPGTESHKRPMKGELIIITILQVQRLTHRAAEFPESQTDKSQMVSGSLPGLSPGYRVWKDGLPATP
jgi:hypothetical protein